MLLGNEELGRRFTNLDEKEQKEKLNSERSKELEFSEETVSSTANNEASSCGASVASRKHLKEDTVMNRMVYWKFSEEQKVEGKKALAAKIPKQTILSYFYPETPIGEMVQIRESIEKKRHA